MTKPKYRLTMAHLDRQSNVHKLERDGFTKAEIMTTINREMTGSTARQREEIVSKLYDRQKGE